MTRKGKIHLAQHIAIHDPTHIERNLEFEFVRATEKPS